MPDSVDRRYQRRRFILTTIFIVYSLFVSNYTINARSLVSDYLSHDDHRAAINEPYTAQDIKRMLGR